MCFSLRFLGPGTKQTNERRGASGLCFGVAFWLSLLRGKGEIYS